MSATTITTSTSTSTSTDDAVASFSTPPRVRLRITRRGRRVVSTAVGLLVAGVVGGVLLAGPGAVASDTAGAASFDYVTVDGETPCGRSHPRSHRPKTLATSSATSCS